MSKSLRTRPMTLYGKAGNGTDSTQSVIPPVQHQDDEDPYDEHSQLYNQQHPQSTTQSFIHSQQPNHAKSKRNSHRDSNLPGGGKRDKDKDRDRDRRSGFRKASDVGNNLKKRLSMRYAQPTTLGPGGYSYDTSIPEVPSLPKNNNFISQNLPIMGQGFSNDPQDMSYDQNYNYNNNDYGSNNGQSGYRGGDDQNYQYQDPTNDFQYQDDDDSGSGRPRGSGESVRSFGSGSAVGLEAYGRDPAIDLKALSADKFDAQNYLRVHLSQYSHSSLLQFQSSLRSAQTASQFDLQRQVFKNYSEFITISKEIATLENDMLELKELLGEWRSGGIWGEEEGPLTSTTRTLTLPSSKANRTSMVDLQQIYRAQITSLWEGIEGSQKFLPYQPGRHLIFEGSTFTSLNSATYQPSQSVSLFLLDDLLLIAVRKKRQMSTKVRLVAERCFNLSEIVVVDLKDGGDLTNAIKIRRGKENFVYRSDRLDQKKALLNAFRKVAEELANKRRKETMREVEERKRSSTLLGDESNEAMILAREASKGRGGGAEEAYKALMEAANGTGGGKDGIEDGEGDGITGRAKILNELEKKDPDRWINDIADQLAVHIALREWEEATALVEKGKAILTTYPKTSPFYSSLSSKLSHHTSSLISSLSSVLSSPTLKKSEVIQISSHLLRLNQGELARELFLNARSALLAKRSRMIRFEGDTSLYVSELALVHFTLIKNTSEWYVSAFKDNKMASGFVKWASQMIMDFSRIFRRQVYADRNGGISQGVEATSTSSEHIGKISTDNRDRISKEDKEADEKVVREAIEITKSSASQLKDVGLDFGYLLDELLRPEGLAKPIPSLTLTLPDSDPSHASETHRLSSTAGPNGGALSSQELRRMSMMPPQSVKAGGRG